MGRPFLSVIVPAYNEEKRLASTIPGMCEALEGMRLSGGYEVIVVDDGSTDGTADLARSLLADVPGTVLSYHPNRGKGGALREGMLHSRARIRLLTDADLSTPIEELPRFLEAHERGYDVVIGSRKCRGARVEVHQPWLRESMGKVFTFLSAILVVPGISDFTCGFKSFTGDAADSVFSRLRLTDWSYDTELLWRVRDLRFRLKEVPVLWRDDSATRVNRLRDTLISLRGLGHLLLIRHGFERDDPR